MKTQNYAVVAISIIFTFFTNGCASTGFHLPFGNVRTTEADSTTKVCEFAAIDVSASSGGKKGAQFKNYVAALQRQMNDPVCGTRYVVFRADDKVENDDVLLDADLPSQDALELGMGCLQKKSVMRQALSRTVNTLNADAPGSDLLGLMWLMQEASTGCDTLNIMVYSDLFIHTKSLNTNFIAMPSKSPEDFFKKTFSGHSLPVFRPHLVESFTVVRHTQGVQPEVIRWTEKLWKQELLPHMGIPGGRVSFKLVTQNTL